VADQVKSSLADKPWSKGLTSVLRGMTGVAWSYEEPSAAARVVKDFVKDNEKLKVKAGLLEGQVLDSKAVSDQLATLQRNRSVCKVQRRVAPTFGQTRRAPNRPQGDPIARRDHQSDP